MLPDAEIERVLVVTAHPDDVDFGAGGTVASWTRAGLAVTYAIITNGDAGGFDPDVPREQIPAIRQAEQRAAGERLGVHDVRFLGYVDGELTVTHDLRRDISRVIRQVRPQRMVVPVARAQLGPDRRVAPGPHGGRRGGPPGRLPGRAQPVRAPVAAARRGAGRVDGARGVGDGHARRPTTSST